ncbi:MAG: aminopeptidase [Thermoplasmatota archaeon]
MEKEKKAEITLMNCLLPRRSDRVLILCDRNTLEMGQAFFDAADAMKLKVILVEIPVGTHHGDDPPNIVADAMIHSDVIVAPTTFSITYTNATRAALARGARVATMPGLTMEMLDKGGLDADYEKIARTIRKFGRKFQKAQSIKVVSEAGTDIEFSIEGRNWILDDNGVCHRRGSITNLPAGKVFIAPLERTANGIIVIDGAFMGSTGENVEMELKDGLIISMKGPGEAMSLMDHGKCAKTLCEFGIGMNPKSRVIGNILEDQKALGTVHFGFGDNSTFGGQVKCDIHVDGMVLTPDVMVDDEKIIEKGKLRIKL